MKSFNFSVPTNKNDIKVLKDATIKRTNQALDNARHTRECNRVYRILMHELGPIALTKALVRIASSSNPAINVDKKTDSKDTDASTYTKHRYLHIFYPDSSGFLVSARPDDTLQDAIKRFTFINGNEIEDYQELYLDGPDRARFLANHPLVTFLYAVI